MWLPTFYCHWFSRQLRGKLGCVFYFIIIWGSGSAAFGEGNGILLQYSCLANPMDGGAWWAAVHGVARSRTRLSDFTFTFMRWRRKWQPTPVFLPGESQGRRSLVGCRLWGRTESDTTEATQKQRQYCFCQNFFTEILEEPFSNRALLGSYEMR